MEIENKADYHSYYLRVSFALVRDGYLRTIGVRAFAVFMIIRTYTNLNNVAFPSIRRIASLSGLSVRGVQLEIRKLEQDGWIEITRNRDSQGKYLRNIYRILEQDLVRGSGDPDFIDYPAVNPADGG